VAAAAHDPEGLAQRVVGRGERALGLAHALDDVDRDAADATTGSTSYSTSIASHASSATARDSAITAATTSPA
jgi:hypothetical protein